MGAEVAVRLATSCDVLDGNYARRTNSPCHCGLEYDSVYDVVTFFFFQAEDGIRDLTVTGVQTCALPISRCRSSEPARRSGRWRSGRRLRCSPTTPRRRPTCGAGQGEPVMSYWRPPAMARSTASSSARPASGAEPAPGEVARVYLDYGGFAPVDPRVVALMRPFLEGGIGNPSAGHSVGLEARASLESARAKVARLIGGAAAGVVFTASATEANNLAIKGVALRSGERRHIVTSAVEHHSVVNSCRDLEKRGYGVSWVPVDELGRVDSEAVAAALRPDTALVSIQAASGEIGTIQPLREIGRAARARGVPFHVDAVGAAGRLPLSVDEQAIGLLTLSSNALSWPPGSGSLWARP